MLFGHIQEDSAAWGRSTWTVGRERRGCFSYQGLVIQVYIALKAVNPNLGSRIPGCNSVRIASRMIKRLIDLEVG